MACDTREVSVLQQLKCARYQQTERFLIFQSSGVKGSQVAKARLEASETGSIHTKPESRGVEDKGSCRTKL
jgi:hypothetical protein